MSDIINVLPEGLKRVIESIDKTVINQNNDPYFSIQDISKNGWIGGAKYASIKKLIDGGKIKSISLDFPNRPPVKKIHAEDLKIYISNAYK